MTYVIELSLLIYFGAVKGSSRGFIGASKKKTLMSLFPMAKMDGVIISEHARSFEAQQSQLEDHHGSQSPPPYEKVLSIVTDVSM